MRKRLGTLVDRRLAEYSSLISDFIDQIKDLDLTGIEEPHLPVIGQDYERSRYKIAFCGMETLGWGSISEFIKKDAESLVTYADYTINDLEYLGWPRNYHATFWGFILKFLSKFYQIPFKDLIDAKQPDLLRSFVWANANSIERYCVTAEKKNASYDSWKKVKKASLPFDNLNHIINTANPKVVFILYSGASQEYYLDLSDKTYGLDITNKRDYLKIENKEFKYFYYYRRDTATHIFNLPHPTRIGLFSEKSIDEYVDSLIKDISDYHIWETLPTGEPSCFFSNETIRDNSSIQYKRNYIAKLATFLVENDSVMSGKELQELFNRNGILTSHGFEYSIYGGRGIHRLITNAWAYYYNNKDFQTAYNIARAFVKQNGEYAYE